MSTRDTPVHQITQRQLRNDSSDVLRRAAAGEVFRIRSGDQMVELARAVPDPIEALRASGQLSTPSGDDFADFEWRNPGGESSMSILERSRAER